MRFAIIGGVVIILAAVWYSMQPAQGDYMPEIRVSEPTNFSHIGILHFPPVPSGQATGTIEYAVNSAPVIRELVMDELSICSAVNGAVPCMAMSITFDKPFDGARAIVEGLEQGESVTVRKLHVLQEGEPELPIATGSMFVSWPHAIEIFKSCQATMVMQTHAHDVYIDLKDGRKVRAVEPMIDEVFAVLEETSETCGTIPVATE